MAYEYAKKGACLVIVARRKKKLEEVAAQARELGSPDVVVVCGDVSNINECKQFIDEAIHHFGRCKIFLFPFCFLFFHPFASYERKWSEFFFK